MDWRTWPRCGERCMPGLRPEPGCRPARSREFAALQKKSRRLPRYTRTGRLCEGNAGGALRVGQGRPATGRSGRIGPKTDKVTVTQVNPARSLQNFSIVILGLVLRTHRTASSDDDGGHHDDGVHILGLHLREQTQRQHPIERIAILRCRRYHATASLEQAEKWVLGTSPRMTTDSCLVSPDDTHRAGPPRHRHGLPIPHWSGS